MAAVVALVGGCASSTRSSPSTSLTPGIGQTLTGAPPPAAAQTTAAPPPVGMNQKARDDTFGFTALFVAATATKLETTMYTLVVPEAAAHAVEQDGRPGAGVGSRHQACFRRVAAVMLSAGKGFVLTPHF